MYDKMHYKLKKKLNYISILEWILYDCEWMWECLGECEHSPTSEYVNVYVSDYEYMDVSITVI